jgi:hypothetical protein
MPKHMRHQLFQPRHPSSRFFFSKISAYLTCAFRWVKDILTPSQLPRNCPTYRFAQGFFLTKAALSGRDAI